MLPLAHQHPFGSGSVKLDSNICLVWGDPGDPAARVVVQRAFSDQVIHRSPDLRFATIPVGPLTVTGPILNPVDLDGGTMVVLADSSFAEWATREVLADWGWEPASSMPTISRYPFQVDALVLAPNWAGTLDGWSQVVWLDTAVRPMQRTQLAVDHEGHDLTVHVLQTGQDQHGISYAIMYAPDRDQLDAEGLTAKGWRAEPPARIRRQQWHDLADLSLTVQAHVSTFRRQAFVSHVTVHEDVPRHPQVVDLLPADVKDALLEALEQDVNVTP
jgi:hypothetical protein